MLKHETVEKRKREGGREEREMEGEQKRNGRRGIECENGWEMREIKEEQKEE